MPRLLSLLCLLPVLAHAGEVTGRVVFEGTPPARQPIAVTSDKKVCGRELPDESLLLDGDGLRGVVVSIDAPGEARPGTALLEQRTCLARPRVQAVTKGTALAVSNADRLQHVVEALKEGRSLFVWPLPFVDRPRRYVLDEPGLVEFRCEAGHPWTRAFVHVFSHPHFAVSGREGRWRIPDVPDGTWKLTAWHERLGTRQLEVVVKDGAADVTLVFRGG